MSSISLTVTLKTQSEMIQFLHGMRDALTNGMTVLTKREIDATLAALMDAYRYYVSMAKAKRANPKEAALWLDKASNVETLALAIQSKPTQLNLVKG